MLRKRKQGKNGNERNVRKKNYDGDGRRKSNRRIKYASTELLSLTCSVSDKAEQFLRSSKEETGITFRTTRFFLCFIQLNF